MADSNSQNKTWRVVKIFDEYHVLINAGTDDKIKEGDLLKIFGTTEEIIDPETKKSLGTLEKIKASVRVIHVQKNMCVAENVETYEAAPADIITQIVGTPLTRRTYLRKLPVDPEDFSGGWEREKIKIGDPVKKLAKAPKNS